MTMRFHESTYVAGGSGCRRLLFAFLDWMRTASPAGPGWTISHSSDGTTGGAGDYITSITSLAAFTNGVARSYFVLRSPDGSRQILYYRYIVADDEWAIVYNPHGDYTGGDEWNLPTSAGGFTTLAGGGRELCNNTTNGVLHIGADDTAPYGFFLWTHGAGDYNNGFHQIGCIPITDDVQASDTDPVVMYVAGNDEEWRYTMGLCNEGASTTIGRAIGHIPAAGSVQQIAFPYLRTQQVTVAVPNDGGQNGDNDDVGIPMTALRPATAGSGGYKGITTFIRWNSVDRAPGETFNNNARVSLGDVNAEWTTIAAPILS